MFEIISRTAAANLGRRHFYTGKPCVKGHVARRFVSTGVCMECNRARSARFTARPGGAAHFIYPLHPDDVAAALAYCQALDMQRGRKPTMPTETPSPVVHNDAEFVLPAHIQRHRDELLRAMVPKASEPYIPKG
jgi:hypothetical protein